MSKILGLKGVSVQFPGSLALDDVTLDINRGDILAVVGANGSGKTTLLSVLTGQLRPTAGTLVGSEGALALRSPADALALGIALVPQEPLHAPTLPAWENLLLGSSSLVGRAPSLADRRWACEHLRRVLPHVDPQRPLSEMRKADRVVLALERSKLASPKVLALDEPTAVLGDRGVTLVETAARSVSAREGAVVLVSHRLKDIVRLATRVAVLVDGRLKLDSPVGEVSVEHIVETLAAGRGVGRKADERYDSPPDQLRARRGSKTLVVSTRRELSGLDLDISVNAGEIVGVAGMAGSGRTRLCKLVAGLGGAAKGIEYLGQDLPATAGACRRRGIAYIPEDRLGEGIFPTLSVAHNIELGDVVMRSLASVVPPLPPRRRIGGVLERFGIKTPSTSADITVLSGGNAQRVVVARELMNNPCLVIADEPTQGVDRTGRAAIHALLRAYADRGGSVLLVSSEFEELQELASRIYVIADGRIVDEVDSKTPYAKLVALASGVEPLPEKEAIG